jgi:acetyl-CoA carboxylase biotin carboxyl carrier protein
VELKQVKELMTSMQRAGIKKLRIKEKDGYEVELERQDEALAYSAPVHPPIHHPVHHPVPAVSPLMQESAVQGKSAEEVVDGKYVASPMVGTFYAAPSPDDPPFVRVGDAVDENTIVCIIEAMKVMNEVKAGMKGVVAEVLVESAHPVEFGTKLFRIS